MTLADLSILTGLTRNAIDARLRSGMPILDAVTLPRAAIKRWRDRNGAIES